MFTPVASMVLGTLAAGMIFLLGRSTAPATAGPQPLSSLLGAYVNSMQRSVGGANITSAAIQPELLQAAHMAANENGALILAVCRPS